MDGQGTVPPSAVVAACEVLGSVQVVDGQETVTPSAVVAACEVLGSVQ